MKGSTSKEKVLKRIRDALVDHMPAPFHDVDTERMIFAEQGDDFLEETFARAFISSGGKFVFCADVDEMTENLKALVAHISAKTIYYGEEFLTGILQSLDVELLNKPEDVYKCDVALTACEALVARHGIIVCSSNDKGGRRSFVAPPVHIVFATNKQLVNSLKDAMRYLNDKYKSAMPSLISFISGPSRTADIEKTLVHGAHGPKELYLFMLDMSEPDA